MTTIAREVEQVEVAVGVDTHGDTHTAAVIDTTGRLLGCAQFSADAKGYAALLTWAMAFGMLLVAAIEGTGAYGAGLARYLRGAGVELLEIDRPDRKTRRFAGKSDPLDAEAAARAGLSRARTGVPKDRSGKVEALRNLRVARRSAVDQRADCMRRIKTLLVTAPDGLRERLRRLSDRELLHACAGLRPDTTQVGEPEQAAKVALRSLARRHAALVAEIDDLDELIGPLVARDQPGPARTQRRRHGRCGTTARHRRGEHRPASLRSSVRDALRRRAHPRILREDPPTPTQPRRRQTSQRRPLPHRPLPTPMGPQNPGLHATTHQTRSLQEGHHPLPQTPHRPRDLQRPHRLTSIGASTPPAPPHPGVCGAFRCF